MGKTSINGHFQVPCWFTRGYISRAEEFVGGQQSIGKNAMMVNNHRHSLGHTLTRKMRREWKEKSLEYEVKQFKMFNICSTFRDSDHESWWSPNDAVRRIPHPHDGHAQPKAQESLEVEHILVVKASVDAPHLVRDLPEARNNHHHYPHPGHHALPIGSMYAIYIYIYIW